MTTCLWEADYGRSINHLEEIYNRLLEIDSLSSFKVEFKRDEPPFIRIKREGDYEVLLFSSISLKSLDIKKVLKLNKNRLYIILGELNLDIDYRETSIFQILPFNPSILLLEHSVLLCFEFFYLMKSRSLLLENLNKNRYRLSTFLEISFALNTIKEPKRLFEFILRKYREITNADAGSIYVIEEKEDRSKVIKFITAQNDSTHLELRQFELPLDKNSIAGSCAIERKVFNIPDVNESLELYGLKHDRSFDRKIGYITRSMLVVPLIDQVGETIGVVQLINKKRDRELLLLEEKDFYNNVIPFSKEDEELLTYLSSQVAISLENTLLYNEIVEIFEGFVKASVNAIEQRDPPTSGHMQRVAELSLGLAEVLNKIDYGRFKDIYFDKDDLKRLRYAALLHDFGKIGVKEKVLQKSYKLPEGRLELIKERLKRVKLYLSLKGEVIEGISAKEIDDFIKIIEEANKPFPLSLELKDKLKILNRTEVKFPDGENVKLLEDEELEYLFIEKGSLTLKEKEEIQKHALYTYEYLKGIPWRGMMKKLPYIASMHHEKLDGSGYPWGLKEDEIPIESRIIMIADLFDALYSSDRPYKPRLPVEKCIEILRREAESGKIDKELVEIFIKERIYEKITK